MISRSIGNPHPLSPRVLLASSPWPVLLVVQMPVHGPGLPSFFVGVTALLFSFRLTFRRSARGGGEKNAPPPPPPPPSPRTRLIGTANARACVCVRVCTRGVVEGDGGAGG